jgi:histidyl-tRNA synthetase
MAISTNPARGMRDFLPVDVRRREYVIEIIKRVYQSFGFEPLETPAVENLETLTGKYGEEGSGLIFKILKRGEGEKTGEADLALRYDLTVPLARVVANNKNELPRFFKRFQIQPVWRADRPARGRFREFYQCDVDAIGSKSMIVEAELCAAVSEILQRLGFDDFVIRINHREILYALLDAVGIAGEKQTEALVALDKLDKIGNKGVSDELENRGIEKDAVDKLLGLFDRLKNSHDSGIPSILSEFIGSHEAGRKGIEEISRIFKLADLKSLKIDASLARGLSYYTGTIFEINVPDLAGSIASGGRYDGLIGMFGKELIPACGFSIGLERILVVMNERGMFPPELDTNAADVLVTIWSEETIVESLSLANDLRKQGLRVFLYPEADKLGKQFKYAAAIDVRFVAILGDEERASGKVALKNMDTGEQHTVEIETVAERIKNHV